MSTEALTIDSAVDSLLAPEEPVQEAETEEVEAEYEETEEVDSEVDDSEEEYDTDEESAETEDEPDYAEPEKIIVKVDGEEVSVTLDDLKRSYSGQGKIQKGMQEAAESRKQAEAMRQQANEMMHHLTAMYQRAQQQGFKPLPQEPSRELFNSDPLGYVEAKMNYDSAMQEYSAEQQQIQQMVRYQQQVAAQEQQKLLAREMELLSERIPELVDPEKGGKFKEALVRTASEQYGYAPEELAGVTDHRALVVLRDAMRWRQSQAKRAQAEEKAGKARPVIKPQAKRTQDPKGTQAQKRQARLKKTGSIDDALGLILNSN